MCRTGLQGLTKESECSMLEIYTVVTVTPYNVHGEKKVTCFTNKEMLE